mgnify:CR=1 FL=1
MHVNNLSTSKRTNWKIHPDFLIFWEPSLLSDAMQQLGGGNNWPYDNNLQIKMSFIVCYHWVGLESSGGSNVVIFRLLSKAVLEQNAKKRHDRFWVRSISRWAGSWWRTTTHGVIHIMVAHHCDQSEGCEHPVDFGTLPFSILEPGFLLPNIFLQLTLWKKGEILLIWILWLRYFRTFEDPSDRAGFVII